MGLLWTINNVSRRYYLFVKTIICDYIGLGWPTEKKPSIINKEYVISRHKAKINKKLTFHISRNNLTKIYHHNKFKFNQVNYKIISSWKFRDEYLL